MKQFVVIFALIAVTLGAPAEEAPSKRSSPAVEHKEERDDSGQYTLRYVTAEGTVVSEQARLVPTADGKDKVLVTEGEVSFVGPDGKSYVTKWSAGMDGMKVEGAHLPVAPEVPMVPEPAPVVATVAEPAMVAVAAPVLPQANVVLVSY